jgi:hypothetical protein
MDYKKYSLEKLQEWVHDSLSSGEASPHEIYSAIREAVREDYYYHKDAASRSYGLLELLSGHRPVEDKELLETVLAEREYYEGTNTEDKILSCDKDDPSPECKKSWNDFWDGVDEKHSPEYNLREAEYYNKRAELDAIVEQVKAEGGYDWTPEASEDKVVKWQLPIEVDGASGEYYVQFPDDLMEAANIKETDFVEWVDQGNGSYLLRKV